MQGTIFCRVLRKIAWSDSPHKWNPHYATAKWAEDLGGFPGNLPIPFFGASDGGTMASDLTLGLMELSVVREMTNIGLGHATTALSEMTGRAFNMSVPDVESLSLEEIPALLGGAESFSAGIYMPIEGDVSGHIAFLMPWASAQSLWKMLLGAQPESPDEISEMDASAVLEIGNIINSSFLNAISDMTNLSMHATPPYFAVEMSAAILDAIVVEASSKDHVALAIRTVINDYEGSMEGFFVYIPSLGGLRHLFSTLGIAEAA